MLCTPALRWLFAYVVMFSVCLELCICLYVFCVLAYCNRDVSSIGSRCCGDQRSIMRRRTASRTGWATLVLNIAGWRPSGKITKHSPATQSPVAPRTRWNDVRTALSAKHLTPECADLISWCSKLKRTAQRGPWFIDLCIFIGIMIGNRIFGPCKNVYSFGVYVAPQTRAGWDVW